MNHLLQFGWLPRRSIRNGAGAALVGALLLLLLVLFRTKSEVTAPPSLTASTPSPAGAADPSTLDHGAATLDPAAQAELERLSRSSHAELLAAARAKSGLSRLLAMNVLWARGEHAAVEELAKASGDRTLVAKAQALAGRSQR